MRSFTCPRAPQSYLLLTTYHSPLATYNSPSFAHHIRYHLPLITYHLPPSTCRLPLTSSHLPLATCDSLPYLAVALNSHLVRFHLI